MFLSTLHLGSERQKKKISRWSLSWTELRASSLARDTTRVCPNSGLYSQKLLEAC